ncbi:MULTISPECIES: hypothetical protein [Dysgonomonadaceae]|jgi:hypothetical protein|uniref:hypothetical protein n=1 Tax=Dysgonomonadaceae TaxID=2005520 RepID=UPI000E981889|nr:hypothetical protein [Proteiniphilum sp. UBA5480]HBK30663.1 hypothetical protein [Porphyromonadaceae bacterium]HBX18897.1 hypothetical protein [Porphyromonadaceae bacterium]HBX46724.1 hypothetical protein [Porphyromonadaceae bacterium]HCM21150.1 hypothetical protein [Porphyromonadaceae bacterium]
MGQDALKIELIEWLARLEDEDTIRYLKVVKDGSSQLIDWSDDLTDEQKAGIEKGLQDIDNGKTIPHDIIKQQYGIV